MAALTHELTVFRRDRTAFDGPAGSEGEVLV